MTVSDEIQSSGVEEDLQPTLDDFGMTVRTWLERNAPRTPLRVDSYDREAEARAVARARTLQAALFEAGLAGLTWPKEYGGRAFGTEYQRMFVHEANGYDLGTNFFNIAFGMVGPTILQLGTEDQKSTYIPKVLQGESTWCQLFSEPSAGSDVASLQTRAVRDGDEWVINGQKVWTSGAHRADFGALLARTNPELPKHQGLTMFILDMKSPGVTVRPLRQITGDSQFNEVFLDDVRVPASDVIGEVDQGWRAAVAMLMNERVAIGALGGGSRDITAGSFERLLALARDRGKTNDPVVRQQLAQVYCLSRILGFVRQRTQAAIKSGRTPGPEGSIAKLLTSELLWATADAGTAIAGASAQAWDVGDPNGDAWARESMSPFIITIGGGTNEIQRNIIGERVLGLPKEPQVDRDIAFNQLPVGTERQ